MRVQAQNHQSWCLKYFYKRTRGRWCYKQTCNRDDAWCTSWGIWGYKHNNTKDDVWSTSTREWDEDEVTNKRLTEMMLDVLL